MQGLGADHDRVQIELVLLGRPAAVADAPVQLEELDRVDAAAPGHAVLAVGGEHHVIWAQRAAGPDLGGFLAEQRGPDAELALALQRDRHGVDGADQHQVPVHAPDVVGGQVQRVVGRVDPLTLRGEQLDELARLVGQVWCGLVDGWCGGGRGAGFDGHVPLLSGPGLGSPAPAVRLKVPGLRCLGAVAYAACPVGTHAPAVPVGRSSPDDICPDRPGGYVARMIVEVMLKPEIHDPQGEAIASACHRLGFGQVLGVRQGKRFEVELDGPADEAAVTAITNLARDLLSNPVIEEFTLRAGEA